MERAGGAGRWSGGRGCGLSAGMLRLEDLLARNFPYEDCMGRIGLGELIVIAIIAVLLLGAGRLSDIGKGLGEGIRNLKKGLRDDSDPPVVPPAGQAPPAAPPAGQASAAAQQPSAPTAPSATSAGESDKKS